MNTDTSACLDDLLSADRETDPEADHEPAAPTRRRRRRSPLTKVILWLLACLFVLGAIPLGAVLYVGWRLDHNVHRVAGAFVGLQHRPSRPHGAAAAAVNILLLGTDRRSDVPTTGTDAKARAWVPGAQRSDTMMIVHISGDRRSAWLMSIPRDSWVPIPGHGFNKINAAFSYGGLPLVVDTVEHLTDVRIDHLAMVDWDGFKALTDQVGGVDVDVPTTVTDSARQITWTQGRHHLDGAQALAYVGQRYGLPGGDLDRVARQQAFLRSLMQTSLHQEMRKDPRELYGFLGTVTRHLTVDADWSATSMVKLMASLRNLRSANIDYLTVPVAGFGREGDQSVVYLSQQGGDELWKAVRDDRLTEWSELHANQLTGAVVN